MSKSTLGVNMVFFGQWMICGVSSVSTHWFKRVCAESFVFLHMLDLCSISKLMLVLWQASLNYSVGHISPVGLRCAGRAVVPALNEQQFGLKGPRNVDVFCLTVNFLMSVVA